jgi:hypothetical protein
MDVFKYLLLEFIYIHIYTSCRSYRKQTGLVICTMSGSSIPEKAVVSPPSVPALLPSVVVTAILSLALGYWVGIGNSFPSFGRSKRPRNKQRASSDDGASSSSEISSEDETDLTNHQLRGFSREECKLVRFLFSAF